MFTVYIYILLSFLFAKQVLDKVRDLLKDVDFFDDFYKCEFVVTTSCRQEQTDFSVQYYQIMVFQSFTWS